jgi:hypothetical protein
MDTVITAVAEWWEVGVALAGGMVVLGALWRWVLADFVLERVELP